MEPSKAQTCFSRPTKREPSRSQIEEKQCRYGELGGDDDVIQTRLNSGMDSGSKQMGEIQRVGEVQLMQEVIKHREPGDSCTVCKRSVNDATNR